MLRVLPPRPFFGSLAARVVLVWAFLRAMIAAAVIMDPGGTSDALSRSFVVSGAIAALVVAVTFVEMSRRSELLFLANLGRSFRDIALVVVAECAVLEVLLRAAIG